MCNWRRWVWPGIIATVVLTALAMFFHSSSIEQDLTAKATTDLQAEHPWASVALDGRDLTVEGIAPSEAAAAAAGATALAAYDVRVVADATTLPPVASPYPFKAIKGADGITLTGNYPSDDARAEIVAAAEAANPGISVTDEMTLARGAPAGFAALAAFGLTQVGSFTEGETSLSDLDYNIKGIAPDSKVFEAETAKAAGALPSGAALAAAEIMAPTASPYTWSATKDANQTITLSGFTPSSEARAAVVSSATSENPDATIVDEMQIALGEPAEYDALTAFGLGQLDGLAAGTASLTDSAYAISGTAKTSASYDAEVAAANATLPGASTLASEAISPPAADGAYNWAANKASDGTITLTGLMPDAAARDRIAARATELNPDAKIVNEMELATGAPNGFVDNADYSLGYLPKFVVGAANLSNDDLNIRGRAVDLENYNSAVAMNDGVADGVNLADDIGLPRVSPYVWKAENSERLEITGYVPSLEVKSGTVAEASSLFGSDTEIVDSQILASGEPDGFQAATSVGIQAIDELQNGVAEINNTQLSVSGIAATGADKTRIENSVLNDVPTGFTGVPSITVAPKPKPALKPRPVRSVLPKAEVAVAPKPKPALKPRPVRSVLPKAEVAVAPKPKPALKPRPVRSVLPKAVAEAPEPIVVPEPVVLAPNLCQLNINRVLEGGINFETNEAIILDESKGVLDKLVLTANQCPDASIEVSGHTDSRASIAYNQRLSERRATAVANYLIVEGVSSARLSVSGKGELEPIATNDTEEGRAQNRRIEFVIKQ